MAASFSYNYDKENRLVKASDASGVKARFAYDGDGKRAKRVDDNGTIHYVGNHYERNVGNGQITTEVVTKYYYGSLGKINRLIAFRRGTDLRYVCPDHLGGTVQVIDNQGNVVGWTRYHSFGADRASGGSLNTDKKFTGQTQDASTRLYFYGARYYDPAIGRFLAPDTIVPDYKNPQSLNRYSYGYNNPLKYVDPTGHGPSQWDPQWVNDFKAAHQNQDPTEQDWQDYQLSTRYRGNGPNGTWTDQDWETYGKVRAILGPDLLTDWQEGRRWHECVLRSRYSHSERRMGVCSPTLASDAWAGWYHDISIRYAAR